MRLDNYDIIVVGCGLSGVVIAERFSLLQNKKVLVIDKRDHIGGNCYDYHDEETNILMNKYGAHLFHTNNEEVFEYINKYGNWSPWEHKVLGLIDGKHLPIPPNITTVNKIFNLDIKTEEEMNKWLSENQVKYDKITNGEEMAKSRVGEVLYDKIFKHYTFKQWKKYPEDLAPEVLARIPVRNSLDDRYFSDKYQVLPEKGYTAFFQSILDKHKHNIDVKLNFDFFDIKDQIKKEQIVIYTGPIDSYFADKGLEKLEYRSIDFHIERQMNIEYYQPYSVVNYPSADTPYTRCVEYKHFLNQKSEHTVYVKETTTDTGEPYYPVLNDRNKELYAKYQKMAEEEGENIHFLGRLASYKYFNMDQAIKNSLDYYKEHFENKKNKITIIISRYNEDVDWVNKIKENESIERILIFNKGSSDIYFFDSKIKVINVKNIGREGGTYLDYIIDNYDNYPENLIFTQADPFEHNEKFLEFLKDDNIPLYYNKDFLPLTKQWKVSENIPPQKFVKHNNSYNIGNLELIKYFVRDFDQQVIGHSSWSDWEVSSKFKLFKKIYKTENEMKTICDFIGIENSKKIIPICWSACFFLKSKQIMRNPKEIYIKLRNFLYNSNDQGGVEGYLLERFWYYLFTGESYDTIDECLKELFIDVEPFIKIYCNKRKRVWFKNVKECTHIVQNPNNSIIYNDKEGQQKVLSGVDYFGPNLSSIQCDNLENAKHLDLETNTMTIINTKKIYFYIRGHIRNSLKTARLKNFVNLLKMHFPNIKFILQTWKHIECKCNESWRNIKEDNTIISKQTIENYFEDNDITKQCLIIDEKSIELVGSTNGKVGMSCAPKRGWKNMWYGIYKGLENLDISNNCVVCFRFDYFDLSEHTNISETKIIQFIKNQLNSKDIKFIVNAGIGSDNLYMGNYNKIKALIEKFHFNLDDILNKYKYLSHQEYLVNIVADSEPRNLFMYNSCIRRKRLANIIQNKKLVKS